MEAVESNYKILKLNAVAVWNFEISIDTCSICKLGITEDCILCQSNRNESSNQRCTKVVGRCNHCYHSHCIDEWSKKHKTCPIDNQPWDPQRFLD
jgi:RING-box protein 1